LHHFARSTFSERAFRREKATAATSGGIVNAIFSWPLNFLPERPGAASAAGETDYRSLKSACLRGGMTVRTPFLPAAPHV